MGNAERGAGLDQGRLWRDAAGLDVKFDGATQVVTVSGVASDQATREKIVLCCGNVAGVASVQDRMSVATPAARNTSSSESFISIA